MLLSAVATPAAAQQAKKPAPPPGALEERLLDYKAQQKASKALAKEREKSRLRRLTGAGQPAGARAVENTDSGIISSGTAVRLSIAAGLALIAIQAYTDKEDFRASGGGGGVATSSN